MPRVGLTYFIDQAASAQVTAVSTGTADVQTLTPPARAVAFSLKVETTGIRYTLNGTTPDATNGMPFATTDAELFRPVAHPFKFVSQAAANARVHITWHE